jgi:hypothetical protein
MQLLRDTDLLMEAIDKGKESAKQSTMLKTRIIERCFLAFFPGPTADYEVIGDLYGYNRTPVFTDVRQVQSY